MIDIFSTITLGTRAIFAFCHHRWPNADIIHGKTIIMEVSVQSLQLVKWISFHLLFHESIIHYHQTAEYLCTVEKKYNYINFGLIDILAITMLHCDRYDTYNYYLYADTIGNVPILRDVKSGCHTKMILNWVFLSNNFNWHNGFVIIWLSNYCSQLFHQIGCDFL